MEGALVVDRQQLSDPGGYKMAESGRWSLPNPPSQGTSIVSAEEEEGQQTGNTL